MKSKAHLIILFIESISCIVMVFGRFSIPNPFATVISFPFVQISGLLRGLSLSSTFGNIMAIILYVLLCFSPWLLFIGKRRTRVLEDQLIIILPFVLLYAIYQMINPSALFLFNNLAMNNAILGLLIYSIIFSYFILRAVRKFYTKTTTKLIDYLLIVFVIVNVTLVFQIVYQGLFDAYQTFQSMQINNSGYTELFRINLLFIAGRFIISNLPLFLNVLIVYFGCEVLIQLKETGYSTTTLLGVNKLTNFCKQSLVLILFTNVFFQIIQLIFAKSLFIVNSTFDFPIFSILFIAICILVTNLINENKTLKEENESFI
ncbi:hypothetical protein [Anaerorhabdus sp.]|uniref:hypothetical protein n=1 Tax=Anaerorhabdus sp. TaxID=1872524 RepID=UPI002FCB7D90